MTVTVAQGIAHVWNTTTPPAERAELLSYQRFPRVAGCGRSRRTAGGGLAGPFGHQLTVLEIADAQFEASSGESMRPEVASPGTLKITLRGSGGRRPSHLLAFDPVYER
jgi:hypothetical protein